MKCEEVQERLILLSLGEICEEDAAEASLHLRHCAGCQEEMQALVSMQAILAEETLPELSPNLLTASRLRLDDALDQADGSTWMTRLRNAVVGSWQHIYAAPALATLLLGIGFVSGNLVTRFQAANIGPLDPAITTPSELQSTISNVSGVLPLPDDQHVELHYNQMVPMTLQGRLDDPQVRQLLALAAQKGANNDVRETSVDLLAKECSAGRDCDHGDGASTGFRDALLVSLRYDKSPTVRLRALEGLQHFIGEDQRVRDAVLESLMTDANADVRTRAISMLEPVEGDTSVRQVLHTVSTQDDNPYIRNASLQALGNLDGFQ